MINQNKSKQTYGSLIKVISVSIVAMSCFVLGAFVGRYFGDKQDSYNSEEIQNSKQEGAAEPNKRSLASAETGGQVVIVGKKTALIF